MGFTALHPPCYFLKYPLSPLFSKGGTRRRWTLPECLALNAKNDGCVLAPTDDFSQFASSLPIEFLKNWPSRLHGARIM